MNEKVRKLGFFEINKGRLGEEMQKAFENCQAISHKTGLPSSVTLQIALVPAQKNDRFGSVKYAIKENHPPKKSINITTELNIDGIIIADGNSPIDILQEELEFPVKESEPLKIISNKK